MTKGISIVNWDTHLQAKIVFYVNLKLKHMYEYQSLLFMYDFANNILPHSFGNTFKYNHEIQEGRLTRETNLLREERGTSRFYQHLPVYNLLIWNKWMRIASNDTTRAIFKA